MSKITRRNFIKIAGATAAASTLGFPMIAAAGGKKQVVIVGGGVGGATAAKYIRRADPSIEVTLIEPNKHYYTCFLSNEVLGGERSMDSIRFGYDGLRGHGVKVVQDTATSIDASARKVSTQGGKTFDDVFGYLTVPVDLVRVRPLTKECLQLDKKRLTSLVAVLGKAGIGMDQAPRKLAHEQRARDGRIFPVFLA